jgi:hypothetical protein
MIVPDVNLLLYAEIAAYPEHAKARAWWEKALSGDEDIGLAPPAVFGFVRIATNPRVFDPPMSVDDATARVERWLARPNVRTLVSTPHHVATVLAMLRKVGTAANLTTDAQLAVYAIENGATLHSNDTDFDRFDGLSWKNPLASK